MTCVLCKTPLSGGIDTFGRQDLPLCASCYLDPATRPICDFCGEATATLEHSGQEVSICFACWQDELGRERGFTSIVADTQGVASCLAFAI